MRVHRPSDNDGLSHIASILMFGADKDTLEESRSDSIGVVVRAHTGKNCFNLLSRLDCAGAVKGLIGDGSIRFYLTDTKMAGGREGASCSRQSGGISEHDASQIAPCLLL